jgi:hypothetical protein
VEGWDGEEGSDLFSPQPLCAAVRTRMPRPVVMGRDELALPHLTLLLMISEARHHGRVTLRRPYVTLRLASAASPARRGSRALAARCARRPRAPTRPCAGTQSARAADNASAVHPLISKVSTACRGLLRRMDAGRPGGVVWQAPELHSVHSAGAHLPDHKQGHELSRGRPSPLSPGPAARCARAACAAHMAAVSPTHPPLPHTHTHP